MKSIETTVWALVSAIHTSVQKIRRLLYQPFTFIVLIWIFLWLAFYVASEFI